MAEPRKKRTDLLQQGADRESLSRLWKTTTAADDFAPLPPGEYTFRILCGELTTSKRGTPGYKLTLEVTEGEYEGRRAWHDVWLTHAALPLAKRDLTKLGVTALEQLEQPLPSGILIRGKLVIHRDEDGGEVNRLKRFECIGVEPGDAFEPPEDDADQAGSADRGDTKPPEANGTPTPPEGNGQQAGELFPFGANANGEGDAAAQGGKGFLDHERGGRRR